MQGRTTTIGAFTEGRITVRVTEYVWEMNEGDFWASYQMIILIDGKKPEDIDHRYVRELILVLDKAREFAYAAEEEFYARDEALSRTTP